MPKFKYDKNMNLNDWYYPENETNQYAIEHKAFAWPNSYLNEFNRSENEISVIDKGVDDWPWENKIDKAIFRGMMTSYDVNYHEVLQHWDVDPNKIEQRHME